MCSSTGWSRRHSRAACSLPASGWRAALRRRCPHRSRRAVVAGDAEAAGGAGRDRSDSAADFSPPAALPLSVQSQLVADGRAKARPDESRQTQARLIHQPKLSSGITGANWRPWATGTWLIAVGALFLVALRQRQRTRRLIASAGPAEPELLDVVDALAERVGLVARPDTLRANRVESPMVAGLFTPVVLLPRARFDALPDAQQRMAICHELVHLRRGDLWLGCVPALAERPVFLPPAGARRRTPSACARGGLRRGRAARDGRHAAGLRPPAPRARRLAARRGLRGVQHFALVLEPGTENRPVRRTPPRRTVLSLVYAGGRRHRGSPPSTGTVVGQAPAALANIAS